MAERIVSALRHRLSLILLLISAGLFVLGLLAAVGGVLVSTVPSETRAAETEQGLQDELQQELSAREAEHRALNGSLGVDQERITRDETHGRGLALLFVSMASSGMDLGHQQQLVRARVPSLEPEDPVLTVFLPRWSEVTSTRGEVTYTIDQARTELVDVRGVQYRYISVMRLDPVAPGEQESEEPSEVMVLMWSTDPDGSVSDLIAARTDPVSRDALLADDGMTSDEES